MTVHFEHDGLVISVQGSDDDATWLSEFLDPFFTVVEETTSDAFVSLESGPPLGPPGESVNRRVVFALDSGPVRLPAVSSANGERLFDLAGGVSFDVSERGCHVRITHEGNRPRARIQVMRVVRELAHNHSIRTGGVILHASVVAIDGAAIAIVGNKGSGKTTLAMRLLGVPGVACVTNDRALVRAGARFEVTGIPTIVSLRPGTRSFFPAATARLQQSGDFRENRRERFARGPQLPDGSDDIWRVAPHQLCEALGCRLQARATLAAVLFLPSADLSDQPLRRLSSTEAATAFSDAILCAGTGHCTSEVFGGSPADSPDELVLRGRCAALAANVACFRGRLSAEASAPDALTLIETCLDAHV